MHRDDVQIIRTLAARTAEIAALPVQEKKRDLWRALNGLRPRRPMVMMDQVCWGELDLPELALRCSDPEYREYEQFLRRTLYQWDHFRVDMVVEPFVRVPMAITGLDLGMEIVEETALTDPANDVMSHRYENQFQTEEDLQKIRMPEVGHDEDETARRLAMAHELFDGLLDVRRWGADLPLSLWDPISQWMGVEGALYALIDKPEYLHRLVDRMTRGYLSMIDQLEEQGLFCGEQSLIHCTGAYTDELPAPGYDPAHPRARDIWIFGLAQMFSTVSPATFKEFEVDYAARICERYGLVYYGCCDPLDRKMDEVRQLPNVRKVSMSPWADQERGASAIGSDYVFSRKPNPAHVAMDTFDEDLIRTDLSTTRDLCEKHGCPLELILKDISTIRYEPERLDRWAEIAMGVVGG